MDRNATIFVAGHRGLAGSAIVRALQAAGCTRLLLRTHAELDLAEQAPTRAFFERERPQIVIDAAAKVGGIEANNTQPAEFIRDNLAIQSNLIHEAWRAGAQRLLFLGSNCIYPRDCPQPMKEDYLLTGPPEPTNRPYAIAKIAGVEMCWAYNRQYGTRYAAPIPASLYGPNDNYDPAHSHVISAFIRKFHDARRSGAAAVTAWGSGTPRREFLHADDMAAGCLHLLDMDDAAWDELFPASRAPIVNLGSSTDMSIAELADTVRRALGADCAIEWDRAKPDGMPRKLLDSARMLATRWHPRIGLEEGLRALAPEIDRALGTGRAA
ncbi:MAG: GDP-L-fucose synthase family protein [Burkholderiales bacterium]